MVPVTESLPPTAPSLATEVEAAPPAEAKAVTGASPLDFPAAPPIVNPYTIPVPSAPVPVDAYIEAYRLRQARVDGFKKVSTNSTCIALGLLGGLIGWTMASRTQKQQAQSPIVVGKEQEQGGG
jgi:hypothetical protein